VAVLKALGLVALLAAAAHAEPAATPAPVAPAASAAPPAAAAPAAPSTGDPEPKLSLPTEADRAAWQRSGFRLALAIGYGDLHGLRGAPSGRLLGAELHAGLRLDDAWSLYTTFDFASASKSRGLSGLRFAGTVDPTWHVSPSLALAVGLGFGGIVEGRTGRPDVDPLPSTLDTSYTFPSASPPLPSCSGVGVVGLVRATYAYVIGPRASTIVELEVLGQDTACVAPTGTLEPDTARPIERRQYWSHAGATLTWGIMWR